MTLAGQLSGRRGRPYLRFRSHEPRHIAPSFPAIAQSTNFALPGTAGPGRLSQKPLFDGSAGAVAVG